MSNIKINPDSLDAESKSFFTKYSEAFSNSMKVINDNLAVIGSDWKGKSAKTNVDLLTNSLKPIRAAGEVAANIATNVNKTAFHAADRDHKAAMGSSEQWSVRESASVFVPSAEITLPTVDSESALAITEASVSAAGTIQTEITKLSTTIEQMESDYNKIKDVAGWESGYSNIKDALDSSVSSAKAKLNQISTDVANVVKAVNEAHAFIMKDATISMDNRGSGNGSTVMEQ